MTEYAMEAADRSGAARSGAVDAQLERYRKELTGHCYRMLGSLFEAEDAVQETMLRAWRRFDGFSGRSTLRSWLYRIATNVCLDALKGSSRRARPMDLSSPSARPTSPGSPLPDTTWVEPVPDGRVLPTDGDPADLAVARESVRLAFVAALQHLAPWQRAVLLLREVLGLKAGEVAELIGTTVPSVNSALQRARSTLADLPGGDDPDGELNAAQQALLSQYVDAFERYDMDALTMLLHVDATLSMPPYTLWMRGPDEIRTWLLGSGVGCRGSRLVATTANGSPAFGQYRPGQSGDGFDPWALQVLEVSDGRIIGLNAFRDTDRLFPLFGLPAHLAPH